MYLQFEIIMLNFLYDLIQVRNSGYHCLYGISSPNIIQRKEVFVTIDLNAQRPNIIDKRC